MTPALGVRTAGEQSGPDRGDARRVGGVQTELDLADRGRLGGEPVVGGDRGDLSGEVDVLLGHPLEDELGAIIVIAINRIGADQIEVDVPATDRHARMVADRIAGHTHRGDKPCGGAKALDGVPGVQSLRQLAPVGEVGCGDLAPP